MRALLWLSILVLMLCVLAEAVSQSEFVRAHSSSKRSHCGCVNYRNCTEPCSACCGPGGYADCFKNPSPSAVAPVLSLGCCGARH